MSYMVRVHNMETGEIEAYKNVKAVHEGRQDTCVEFYSGNVAEYDRDIYNVTVMEEVAR